MDFGGSRKKESVAERAKRERQEREAKKKQEEASQKQAKAAIKIQAWRRNVIAKRKARHSIVEEWDGWMGYEPHDNAQKASRSEATGDIARNVGVFLCFYNWDRKAHADRLSFLCKYLLLPQELLKMATLMEGNRYKVASRIFADFLWACLEKSCEAETNDSMYLTGSELRYLVTVWDIRKWIKNLRGQSVALMSRRSLIDRGAYQFMANALVKRVYAVLRAKAQKTRDAVDEKRMKNCGLWITAILHLSMLSLEKGEEGNKEVQEPYLIVFLVEILSLPLLTFAMDRPGLDKHGEDLGYYFSGNPSEK
ncbi:hypothetical protein BC829DRAFT_100590 [Chytridium lagenaria]|nr:hypothetical protein BC829DRAFT_100590 [Chytridium lagenaria]